MFQLRSGRLQRDTFGVDRSQAAFECGARTRVGRLVRPVAGAPP
jgi:hypothetical protein